MGSVLWTAYNAPVNILTTGLNALANNAATAAGGAMQNTASVVYADIEFVSGSTFSPTGGQILVWLLRSIDGGVSYEDGGSSVIPARFADATIAIRSGTTISVRAGASGLQMPPGYYKAVAQNMTGATLPASGNLIRIATYTETL